MNETKDSFLSCKVLALFQQVTKMELGKKKSSQVLTSHDKDVELRQYM
jgi:hypothetical protein